MAAKYSPAVIGAYLAGLISEQQLSKQSTMTSDLGATKKGIEYRVSPVLLMTL
jgi:hypothetical protein